MKVVVTGARGFVGATLVPVLQQAGHDVTILSRQPATERSPVRVVQWSDTADRGAIVAACSGADALVHLAARVHVMRDADAAPEFHRVNTDGTGTVGNIARDAGVRHMVYLSTVKVHGEANTAPWNEDAPLAPADAYARSKAEAEQRLAALVTREFAVTVVRPPLVFGPRARANFERLLKLARAACHLPIPLGGIGNQRSLLYVDNLADAITRVIAVPATGMQTYLLADDPPLSTSEMLRQLARGLGADARVWRLPPTVMRIAAGMIGRRREVARLLDSLTIDASRFRRQFTWAPPVALVDALRRTAAEWLADRGGEAR